MCDCHWLASDNSWARRCLKHVSWRSQRIILCTLEQRMAVSREISRADRCLFGLFSWLNTRSSTAARRTRPLPGCRTIVPVLRIFFSRLLMLPSFQHLSGNSLNSLRAPYCFSATNILLIENHRSLIQICINASLESTPWFIPSASPVRFTSLICHLISIITTTLIIHHSFTLSAQAHNLPFNKSFPP